MDAFLFMNQHKTNTNLHKSYITNNHDVMHTLTYKQQLYQKWHIERIRFRLNGNDYDFNIVTSSTIIMRMTFLAKTNKQQQQCQIIIVVVVVSLFMKQNGWIDTKTHIWAMTIAVL